MALLTSSALCLFGILICSSFLEAQYAYCEQDWEMYKDHCYKLFEDTLPWIEAETDCQNYGAHLASIHSKEESLWVAAYVRKHMNVNVRVWIGLIDFNKNGMWSWTDGTPFDYMTWMKNQPDTYNDIEYCGELTRETNFKEWNDMRCSRSNSYLCKLHV